ncbi:MAG: hypothetical protein AAGA03_20275, partial [Planctomycetota bacterium]
QKAAYAERERERVKKTRRASYSAAADIGELPPVGNPELRAACETDLHLFLQSYFPNSTGMSPFGDPQIQAIKRTERACLAFARNINILPRGFVKSTISENSLIWSKFYGHRRFSLFFGGTADLACDGLKNIQMEIECNDLLLRDFPEFCYPIRKLEGKHERCRSQTHLGELTRMVWAKDTIVFPWIPGTNARNQIIEAYGLLAPPRGKRYRLPDGSQPRPDFVVLDDPQTDDSAISSVQTNKRIRFIKNSIMRLGGHGRKVSGSMNATIIAEGDLPDQMSDRRLHKDWSSVRTKMVVEMPTHLEEWWLDKYATIRHDYDDDDIEGQEEAAKRSTEFYLANREIMQEGAVVAWEHIPLEDGEVDALQHAMNILVDEGPEVFYAECQNEPRAGEITSVCEITAETAERVSGRGERVVSDRAADVVFGIDVHDELLYWVVAAASQKFTGGPIAYGTWPEQPPGHFNLRSARHKLTDYYHGVSIEEAIERGVEDLGGMLLDGPWKTMSGRSLPIGAGLVDVGHKGDEVVNAIRRLGATQILGS